MDVDEVDQDQADPVALERRGRRWLLWSFIFCPCHLPISIAVLGTVLGGTAVGALVSRNTIAVGVGFAAVYAFGLAIGFRHLRAAARAKDCSTGSCRI